MIDQLFTVIERFAGFTDEQKKIIADCVSYRTLKPGDEFIKVNEVANDLGFVVSGVLRYFFIDKHGNEITSNFIQKDDFVTAIESFYQEKKAVGAIKSETKCQLIVIDRECYDKLQNEMPNWHKAIYGFANEFLLANNIFQRGLINEDAKTSYLKFIKQFPEIIKKVPLGHVASYLGITQSTLSRIRRQIHTN